MDLLNFGLDVQRLSVAALEELAYPVARAAARRSHLVRRDRRERDAIQLVTTEHYDAWLIGWPPFHNTTPHDHGGSLGLFVVLDGELVEHTTDDDRPVETILRPHARRVVPPGAVHDVGTGSRSALSVHLYSLPLQAMNFYDEVSISA